MKMINIKNINSKEVGGIYIDQISIVSKLDYLVNKAREIPVYLVDEELMDFFYPPYKRKVLDKEAAKELLTYLNQNDDERRDFEKDTQKIKEVMNRFYETSQERTSEKEPLIVAVGLYIHDSNHNLNPNFKEFQKLLSKINYPCILICPERVLNWAQKLYISPKTLFELVYFHELAHAYIHCDFRDYQKPWYRIVEEAYCNAVALERFNDKNERAEMIYAISKQPVEYRGYTFFVNNFSASFSSSSYLFHYFDIDEIDYILHRFYLRRGIGYLKYFRKTWKLKKIKEDFFVRLAVSVLDEFLG